MSKVPIYTQNAINKYMENKDRISLVLPGGYKDKIRAAGEISVNGYIKRLIDEDLAKRSGTAADPDQCPF